MSSGAGAIQMGGRRIAPGAVIATAAIRRAVLLRIRLSITYGVGTMAMQYV